MTDDLELRGSVAAQLIAMSVPGGRLHTSAGDNTSVLYAGEIERFAFRKRVIADYLDRESPPRDGCSAVVTAGAPGAGKTTALTHFRGDDLTGFRVLDPDIIKDQLIEQAVRDGIYDDILATPLADGHPVAPRELAALVHHESTQLIDQIRRICTSRRENIVIEGTLSWKGLPPRLAAELTEADYRSIEVIAIDADRHTCHEQALSRWWSGRRRWVEGTDALGGRFTPPAAIDICYSDTESSLCTAHALELEELAAATIGTSRVAVLRRNTTGELDITFERVHPNNE
ncbi:zeta toxin family protein [Rhodococcoides kyotonense]|uniref:UDP-N-acetylglucosamine kinase n=1 Tax=Rhodococcoides kyotonense TaxID=398843 RepID=A0A177YF80_9NOCA|nr:zeta toxin family protein [Rhodococcus kyotonensis]OAK53778.1 zeta toxin protein [Rhodococcus kyotonensis]